MKNWNRGIIALIAFQILCMATISYYIIYKVEKAGGVKASIVLIGKEIKNIAEEINEE